MPWRVYQQRVSGFNKPLRAGCECQRIPVHVGCHPPVRRLRIHSIPSRIGTPQQQSAKVGGGSGGALQTVHWRRRKIPEVPPTQFVLSLITQWYGTQNTHGRGGWRMVFAGYPEQHTAACPTCLGGHPGSSACGVSDREYEQWGAGAPGWVERGLLTTSSAPFSGTGGGRSSMDLRAA